MRRILVLLMAAALLTAALPAGCAPETPAAAPPEGGGTERPEAPPEADDEAGPETEPDDAAPEADAPGTLVSFDHSPGYSDMYGASHSVTLERNEGGEWVLVCRDRESAGEPAVVATYAVPADAEARFEAFVREEGVLLLADRPDGDLFAMDYSPWRYTFVFEAASGAGRKRVRYSFGQYKEYSAEDRALLAELDRLAGALRGEKLSETKE